MFLRVGTLSDPIFRPGNPEKFASNFQTKEAMWLAVNMRTAIETTLYTRIEKGDAKDQRFRSFSRSLRFSLRIRTVKRGFLAKGDGRTMRFTASVMRTHSRSYLIRKRVETAANASQNHALFCVGFDIAVCTIFSRYLARLSRPRP